MISLILNLRILKLPTLRTSFIFSSLPCIHSYTISKLWSKKTFVNVSQFSIKLPVNQFWLTFGQGLYQIGVYKEHLFFRLRQTCKRRIKAKCWRLTPLLQLLSCVCSFLLQRSVKEAKLNQTEWMKVCLAWIFLKDWLMFGDLQCSLLKKNAGHTPFVCCARKRFPKFSILFLVVNHFLHVF